MTIESKTTEVVTAVRSGEHDEGLAALIASCLARQRELDEKRKVDTRATAAVLDDVLNSRPRRDATASEINDWLKHFIETVPEVMKLMRPKEVGKWAVEVHVNMLRIKKRSDEQKDIDEALLSEAVNVLLRDVFNIDPTQLGGNDQSTSVN